MNLPVSHLTPGMRLSRPVYGHKGQMLLNKGVELTSSYIRGLKEHRVLAVVVECSQDLNCTEVLEVLEESIRVEAMEAIQTWVETNRKQEDFARVYESVSAIVNEVLAGKIPIGGLAEISAADTYTFAHSIDVCAFLFTWASITAIRKRPCWCWGSGASCTIWERPGCPLKFSINRGH